MNKVEFLNRAQLRLLELEHCGSFKHDEEFMSDKFLDFVKLKRSNRLRDIFDENDGKINEFLETHKNIGRDEIDEFLSNLKFK